MRLCHALVGEGRVELTLQAMFDVPHRLTVPSEQQTLRNMTILRNHGLRMAYRAPSGLAVSQRAADSVEPCLNKRSPGRSRASATTTTDTVPALPMRRQR
ncbi:hypothetical protein GCM10010213_08170 [Microbacterium maritypicum]|uniref:Uncharacterized protein n=1 Tax=Microbacterium maritypicum TaxID=33918 RepID=A0A4Y4B599_MICMQ|nr:hypothetical protein MLI01_07570 [Microbacterium liquefaciens]GGV52174.1 hypothetical protein GCM10010213_08170 [Microbacterium liquefaciens]